MNMNTSKNYRHYYRDLTASQRVALALAAGTTPKYLHVVANGRKTSLDLALRLHQASGGRMPFYETHDEVDWLFISQYFADFPLPATVP